MTVKTGITGGIGSGKTTVCRIFEALGIPVYYADAGARQLMNTDPELRSSLKQLFGNDIYNRDGEIARSKLADIIFRDKSALEKVNSLVHPAVARDFIQWSERQTSPYVLEEAAIIFESGIAARFDKVILVTAPEELRVERVSERDRVEPESVLLRIKNQWPEEKKIELADYIIYNDNSQLLIPQVRHIHEQLLQNSKQRTAENGK
jgi:dephospho-CoA kinase